MDNYEYCAQWAAGVGGRVLDYGCGSGDIVAKLRARGVEAYGCDVFYEAGVYKMVEDATPYIRKMRDGAIPFEDGFFDAIVSNQVMEHVPDLEAVTAEIARVLKPGGRVLHMFPTREVWREAHCEIPFLHRFPRGSTPRVYYAAALRTIGMGANDLSGAPMEWARTFTKWVDDFCHYRSLNEIRFCFARHFGSLEHIEDHWLQSRYPKVPAPRWFQRWFVRRFGGIVVVLRK